MCKRFCLQLGRRKSLVNSKSQGGGEERGRCGSQDPWHLLASPFALSFRNYNQEGWATKVSQLFSWEIFGNFQKTATEIEGAVFYIVYWRLWAYTEMLGGLCNMKYGTEMAFLPTQKPEEVWHPKGWPSGKHHEIIFLASYNWNHAEVLWWVEREGEREGIDFV